MKQRVPLTFYIKHLQKLDPETPIIGDGGIEYNAGQLIAIYQEAIDTGQEELALQNIAKLFPMEEEE